MPQTIVTAFLDRVNQRLGVTRLLRAQTADHRRGLEREHEPEAPEPLFLAAIQAALAGRRGEHTSVAGSTAWPKNGCFGSAAACLQKRAGRAEEQGGVGVQYWRRLIRRTGRTGEPVPGSMASSSSLTRWWNVIPACWRHPESASSG